MKYFSRSRIHMSLDSVDHGHDEDGNPRPKEEHTSNKEWLVLNETFVAEADIASASRYRI